MKMWVLIGLLLGQAFYPGASTVYPPDAVLDAEEIYTDAIFWMTYTNASDLGEDYSGNNEDFTNTGVTQAGGSFDFGNYDGTSYMTRADNANLSLGSDTAFTVTGWFYRNLTETSNRDLHHKGTTVLGTGCEHLCYVWIDGVGGPHYIECYLNDGTSGVTLPDTPSAAVEVNATGWWFYVFRHDPVNDLVKLRLVRPGYEDAEVQESWSDGTQDTAGTYHIGTDVSLSTPWAGFLENNAFWKRYLSDAEVNVLLADQLS